MKRIFFLSSDFFKITAIFGLVVLVTASSVAAAGLTDAEKAQKRQQLADYFSNALIKVQPQSSKKTNQVFKFSSYGSTRFGYDSNVDLNKEKDGDSFYEENIGADAEYSPEGAAIAGRPVSFGLKGNYDYLGYFDRSDVNRQSAFASPYVRVDLDENLKLETAYEFRSWIYDSRDDLNYLSNGAKVSLTYQLTPTLSQKGTFGYERLDYSKRKSLLTDASFSDGDRVDDRYKLSYGLRDRVGRWLLAAEGVWVFNDSNDNYLNYNDYQDAGLDGSVSTRLTDRLILSGFGGWRRRSYGDRLISPAFDTIQKDNWYYAGSRVFYAINTWSGVDLTFTYFENTSNDPNHEYNSTLTSVGFHFYF